MVAPSWQQRQEALCHPFNHTYPDTLWTHPLNWIKPFIFTFSTFLSTHCHILWDAHNGNITDCTQLLCFIVREPQIRWPFFWRSQTYNDGLYTSYVTWCHNHKNCDDKKVRLWLRWFIFQSQGPVFYMMICPARYRIHNCSQCCVFNAWVCVIG